MFNLKDKKVLIVGATGGIGSSLTKSFANAGAILGLASKDSEAMNKIANEVNAKQVYTIDLSDLNGLESFIEKADTEMGGIDVMLCNAGITKDSLLLRMTPEDFEKVININLKGTFNVTKSIVPYMMKKRTGKIVNISSVVGVSGNAGQCNYAASKAGIIGFTKSIAKELASRNILANCVAPGFIDTDMTSVLSDSVKENINAQIPLKRMGSSEEIANSVYFLAGDENTYITGQVLNVDGGMLM